MRRRQVLGQHRAGRRLAGVKRGDRPVPLGVVIVGVDDGLADQRFDRHAAVVFKGNGDQHHLSEGGGFRDGADQRPSAARDAGQRFRPSRVAHHHLVSRLNGEAGDRFPDKPCSDDPDLHGNSFVRSA